MKTIKLIFFFTVFSLSLSQDLTKNYNLWRDEVVKVSKDEIYRDYPTEKELQMYDEILKYRYNEAEYEDYLNKNN
ncbi:MAG: hypothetical protein ACRC5T_00945, partial [Cetobacterium sp.]